MNNYHYDIKFHIDYYPFGMKMPGRYGNDGDKYKYGFNGMESDDEMYNQEGNSYTTAYRQLDVRLGRWFSTDPVRAPFESPYAVNRNNPIVLADPFGDCPDCDENNKDAKKGDTYTPNGAKHEYLYDGKEWNMVGGTLKEAVISEKKPQALKDRERHSALKAWQSRPNYSVGKSHAVVDGIWGVLDAATPVGPIRGGLEAARLGDYKGAAWKGAETALWFVPWERVGVGIWKGGSWAYRGLFGRASYYSVQGADDALRLANGGGVWPSAPSRSALGEGFYAWGSKSEALMYKVTLERHGVLNLKIMEGTIKTSKLNKLSTFNVNLLGNSADDFLLKNSKLYGASPSNTYDYIIRGTNFGNEHFFHKSVFNNFKFK